MSRRPRQNGTASRRLILARALESTARAGPQAATIGALADALGMSKSGVFAHFGSKDALDLAVIEASADRFAQAVVVPAGAAPRGVARVAAMVEGWLGEAEAASPALIVLVSARPGASAAVRQRLRTWRDGWVASLAGEVAEAQQSGELGRTADPSLAAFEIEALLSAAARGAGDGGGAVAIAAARRAIENRLEQLAAER